MTCIVGLVDGSDIIMGGDSAGVSGWDLTLRSDGKVFRNGPMIFGFTDSFRMGQLLRYSLRIPEHPVQQETYEYMVTVFIDAVRDCLSKGGYRKKENDVERGGTFLVGYRSRLFEVNSDFQVGESAHSFAAVGCGQSYALGALWMAKALPAEERVRAALAASETFSAGVRAPFQIERLSGH